MCAEATECPGLAARNSEGREEWIILQTLQEEPPCGRLDFRLPDSVTVRASIAIDFNHRICSDLLWLPKETNSSLEIQTTNHPGRVREEGRGLGGEGRKRREKQAGMRGAEGKRLYPPPPRRHHPWPIPVSMPLDVLVHLRTQPQIPEVSPASWHNTLTSPQVSSRGCLLPQLDAIVRGAQLQLNRHPGTLSWPWEREQGGPPWPGTQDQALHMWDGWEEVGVGTSYSSLDDAAPGRPTSLPNTPVASWQCGFPGTASDDDESPSPATQTHWGLSGCLCSWCCLG